MGCNSDFYYYYITFLCSLHQEAGGTSRTFQEMDDHERSIQEEYIDVGGDMTGATNDWIDSEKANI